MKVLVDYVDFHWDNYQGGSGKSFELTASIDIPDELFVKDLLDAIHNHLKKKIENERPFNQKETRYSIQRIEIV